MGARLDARRTGELHDGRDAHLRGEDRGVARATARLGDDADDERAVERRRLGGREVLRDDDARLGEVRHARRRHAEHRSDGPRADVAQVGHPLGEVAAERLELRGILLDGPRDGVGAPLARRELLGRGLDEALVAGDEGRRLEDLLRGVLDAGGPLLERHRDSLERGPDVAERRVLVVDRRPRRPADGPVARPAPPGRMPCPG